MNGRWDIKLAMAVAVLGGCVSAGAADPGNMDQMLGSDHRVILKRIQTENTRVRNSARFVPVEWVTGERGLNELPATANLLAKQEIPLPPSQGSRIMFHQGRILSAEHAAKIVTVPGVSFCILDVTDMKNQDPRSPFLLEVGDKIAFMKETKKALDVPGAALAVKSSSWKGDDPQLFSFSGAFGCYSIPEPGNSQTPADATVALMKTHIRGFFNFGW
ncbi:MAG TPA: hypothetical protein DCZ01_08495 [Elusimicrobia bacterium]|nr:hypothetical protein [Elusimicrobiota bacterium]